MLIKFTAKKVSLLLIEYWVNKNILLEEITKMGNDIRKQLDFYLKVKAIEEVSSFLSKSLKENQEIYEEAIKN